jgi:hypothetical protein
LLPHEDRRAARPSQQHVQQTGTSSLKEAPMFRTK